MFVVFIVAMINNNCADKAIPKSFESQSMAILRATTSPTTI